jgi:hypothetical protein
MARATKRIERRLTKLEDTVDRMAKKSRKQKKGASLSHLHDHIQRIENKLKVASAKRHKRAS